MDFEAKLIWTSVDVLNPLEKHLRNIAETRGGDERWTFRNKIIVFTVFCGARRTRREQVWAILRCLAILSLNNPTILSYNQHNIILTYCYITAELRAVVSAVRFFSFNANIGV